MKPIDVLCPDCGAPPGVRCWSRTRRGRHLTRGHHPNRARAARGEPVEQTTEQFLKQEIDKIRRRVATAHLLRKTEGDKSQ
jgi:hypothetical protein